MSKLFKLFSQNSTRYLKKRFIPAKARRAAGRWGVAEIRADCMSKLFKLFSQNSISWNRGFLTTSKATLSCCFIFLHENLPYPTIHKDTPASFKKHESTRIDTNRVPIHGFFSGLSPEAAARWRPRSRLGRRVEEIGKNARADCEGREPQAQAKSRYEVHARALATVRQFRDKRN